MKVCIASSRIINYNLYNAYTEERITTGNISPDDKIDYYEMSNNLMEVRLEFVGEEKGQEKIFVKHSGLNEDYNIIFFISSEILSEIITSNAVSSFSIIVSISTLYCI